jgi:hypothetical protein
LSTPLHSVFSVMVIVDLSLVGVGVATRRAAGRASSGWGFADLDLAQGSTSPQISVSAVTGVVGEWITGCGHLGVGSGS